MLFPLLLVVSLTTSLARADRTEWWNCKQDKECVKVPGLCGLSGVINKKFAADFEKWSHSPDYPVASCRELSKEEIAADKAEIPACVKGECQAVAPDSCQKRKCSLQEK